jgi:uncharacterized C2H2 Zn-finger protein
MLIKMSLLLEMSLLSKFKKHIEISVITLQSQSKVNMAQAYLDLAFRCTRCNSCFVTLADYDRHNQEVHKTQQSRSIEQKKIGNNITLKISLCWQCTKQLASQSVVSENTDGSTEVRLKLCSICSQQNFGH